MTTQYHSSAPRLQGRTALVTGASRGIGYTIAQSYAKAGANLVLTASNQAALETVKAEFEEYGVSIACVAADLGLESEVERLFEYSIDCCPELDVLVNNAGIHLGKPFTEHSMSEFDRVMKINVYAVFRLTQLAVLHMQKLGRGKIINISSTAGKWESMNQAAYNTSKHAVVGLTKCVALENAQNGINVNAICPGIVETDIIRNAQASVEASGVSAEEFQRRIESQIPMGRMLQPQEVANIAIYLASEESDGMTGQTLTISGGARMG